MLDTKLATPTASADTQFEIVVFDPSPDGYKCGVPVGPERRRPAGSDSADQAAARGGRSQQGRRRRARVRDRQLRRQHVLRDRAHPQGHAAAGYVSIAPPDGITMPFAHAKFQPGAGDTQELLLSGGAQGSVGAGPQRTRTETWAWNGAAYALKSTQLDEATYLYHAVKDADTLLRRRQVRRGRGGVRRRRRRYVVEDLETRRSASATSSSRTRSSAPASPSCSQRRRCGEGERATSTARALHPADPARPARRVLQGGVQRQGERQRRLRRRPRRHRGQPRGVPGVLGLRLRQSAVRSGHHLPLLAGCRIPTHTWPAVDAGFQPALVGSTVAPSSTS